MRVRTTIPGRCDKPAKVYAPKGGYRACEEHQSTAGADAQPCETPDAPCDYPLDGLGGAPYRPARIKIPTVKPHWTHGIYNGRATVRARK